VKAETLARLAEWERDLRRLKREVVALTGKTVSRISLRTQADEIATCWVEELRSPLEHKFGLPADLVAETSENMKRLHRLSRPSNLRSSYLSTLNAVLRRFQDRFVLPIKQTSTTVESVFDLRRLVAGLPDSAESDYLKEAIDCADAGYRRAAIVLGWCAAIDRIQRKLQGLGFAKFNAASTKLKNQTTGKYKRWNKQFSVTTLGDLQAVFDTDLVVVLEGMGLIDSNQSQRLETCFQYRNHSAHPGEAPIGDAHVLAFFTDVNEIILVNPRFAL